MLLAVIILIVATENMQNYLDNIVLIVIEI